MALDIHRLKNDSCLFCPKPIEMTESTRTWEESGTSDHYYDYTDHYLSVVHSPLEQVFCFNISLEQEGGALSRRVRDNKNVVALIESEFRRLTEIHDSEIKYARDGLRSRISLDMFSDEREKYEDTAIESVISRLSRKIRPDIEEMYNFLSEIMFEEDGRSVTHSEEALEILKRYPGHRLREGTNPHALKSHLDCWQYDTFDGTQVIYGDLYGRIQRRHLKGISKHYSKLFKEFKKMPIRIVPYRQ